MGCDIHLNIEIFDDKQNRWRKYNWEEKYGETWDEQLDKRILDDPFEIGRNYDLFAILANVRNGYGFAGTDTGDAFNCIDRPRGLPGDLSSELMEEDADMGDHSFSYVTLKEILDFDWEQVRYTRGVVREETYREWDGETFPGSLSGGIYGKNIKKVSNEEMNRIINGEELREIEPESGEPMEYSTQIEFQETYEECCPKFVKETIPALKELGPPEKVRLVFGFDN